MNDAQIIEKYQESKVDALKNEQIESESDSESLLELLESLENDEDLAGFRDQRLAELKKEFRQIDRAVEDYGEAAGTIHYYKHEKELMNSVTKSEFSILHFYQPTFPRCQSMNDLLAVFAEKHLPVHVMAIQAEDAPFLVSKLRVKVLPFVVIYKKGEEVARIVGFEGIGGLEGAASLQTLEAYLNKCGVLNRTSSNTKSVKDMKVAIAAEDSDDDFY